MKTLLMFFLVLPMLAYGANERALHENIEGTWEGKWDGIYGVRFTIIPTKKNGYDIFYFVEERLGEPYVELKRKGVPTSRNTVKADNLYFIVNLEVNDDITVVGMFDGGTRITTLERIK